MTSKTRQINKTLELSFDEIRELPCFVFQRGTSDDSIRRELTRVGYAVVAEGETFELDPSVSVGDDVAVYSRGAVRLGRIVKIGKTKIHVAYVTPGGVEDAQKTALFLAGRTESSLRSQIASWATPEEVETRVASALEQAEQAKTEGWAYVVNVTVYQAKVSEVWGLKVNADPLGETATQTDGVAETLEGPERDEAVAYFAEIVETRLRSVVVDHATYIAITRQKLAEDVIVAGHCLEAGALSKADYDARIARNALKVAELDRIVAELEAAKTSTHVAQAMSDADREHVIDRRVQARLATDAAYRNAANAEEQAEREDEITREEEARFEPDPLGETSGKVYEEGPLVRRPMLEQSDEGPRAKRDAAYLMSETDESLREMIDAPVGDVSETTRELARLELESRLSGLVHRSTPSPEVSARIRSIRGEEV